MLLLNAAAMAAITGYGFLKWDYGEEDYNVENEGWFERDSDDGGVDKLGHFWSGYVSTRLFAYVLWSPLETGLFVPFPDHPDRSPEGASPPRLLICLSSLIASVLLPHWVCHTRSHGPLKRLVVLIKV